MDGPAARHQSFSRSFAVAVGALMKTVLALAAIAIAVVGIFIFFTGSSQAKINNAFNECSMRRLEARIDSEMGNTHMQYCMGSKGYAITGCTTDLPLLPNCFTARWLW